MVTAAIRGMALRLGVATGFMSCEYTFHLPAPLSSALLSAREAKLGNVPDLATMDCAHFPRNNVVRIEGRPVGVDRSNIRFLRWQLVHQFGPLLLNHLSDIV